MWTVVPASVIGTSHERSGTPCQDASDFLRLQDDGDALLLIAVADGAGSAKLSHVGSKEAVAHLLSTVRASGLSPSKLSKELARGWMQEVLGHLGKIAEREGITLADLACTLLLGVVARSGAVFCQIGDGAWVVEKDGELFSATWPDNGEFVNVTTFITTESALDTMQFERVEGRVSAVAGFTDGVQALALELVPRKAHVAFFAPLFEWVRGAEDGANLVAPLRGFLSSETVTTRTDDDKTLVLACWREPNGDANGAGQ